MIKQYIVFSALILIAALVLSSVEWGNVGPQSIVQAQFDDQPSAPSAAKPAEGDMSGSDIRGGGAVGSRTADSTPELTQNEVSATSTPFGLATSTGFQIRANPQNPFTNDNADGASSSIEYTRLAPAPDQSRATTPKDTLSTEKSTSEESPQPDNNNTQAKESKEEAEKSDEKDELADIFSDIVLSGHVVDKEGNAIKGLSLELKLLQALPEQKALFDNRILNAQTNEQGVYVFSNLVEGDYHICTGEGLGYGRACQRKRAPHSAADFSLQSTSNASIFGVVKDDSGQPLADVQVSATPRQKGRATTNKSGEYKLGMSVSRGANYKVYFSKKDYQRESAAVKGQALLSGRSQQVDAVMKSFERSGFQVTGTVQDDAGNFLQGRVVRLYSPSLKLNYQLRGSSQRDGGFVIENVQAATDYRLSVNTSGGYLFDARQYQNMEVYDGLSPILLRLQNTGKGTLSAQIYESDLSPLSGVRFRLSSSGTVINGTTDTQGLVTFADVPATLEKRTLNISNTTSPHYSFSGIRLAPGEHKSLPNLLVDSGDYELIVSVQDASGIALAGAQGSLSWSQETKGITSKTVRNQGKVSQEGSGSINFSKLGPGGHTLRISKSGYETFNELIDINQLSQNQLVKLVPK